MDDQEPPSPHDVLVTLVADLAAFDEHVIAMTAEVAMLRHEVSEERQARRTLTAVVAVMGAIVFVGLFMAAGIGVVVFQNRANARRTNDAVAGLAQVQRTLVECTTPGNPLSALPGDRVHECYDEGQRQRAESVQQVIVGIVKGLRDAGAGIPNPSPSP